MGIPAYADAGLGYFKTVEVETMLALLQIIDNPLQDIPMLAVLRSPMAGFNADELADLRLVDRSVSIFEAMRLFAASYIQEKSDPSELVQLKLNIGASDGDFTPPEVGNLLPPLIYQRSFQAINCFFQ
jgi:hypothetical protein